MIERLNEFIESQIISQEMPKALADAITYSMFPGGKRIRPKIIFLVSELLSVPPDNLLPTAAAVELLHASSLVHDDLPALDNDDFRRGKPSLHKAFPEATAILAADYMIGLSFKLLATSRLSTIERTIALQSLISDTWCKIQEGQILDLETGAQRERDALTIYSKKTAALFVASFCAPALFCDVSSAVEENLRVLGKNFGLLFQIIDDLIDTKEEKGRGGNNSDQKNKKETLLATNSREDLSIIGKNLATEALTALSYIERQVGKDSTAIRELIEEGRGHL